MITKQARCWNDEYKYINDWLIKQQKKYENANDNSSIINSDKFVDNLIDHFANRLKILDNIKNEMMNEGETRIFNTQLNKHETNAMEYLFNYLINLRKLEGINSSIDECLKYILKSKSYAIGDDLNWDKTLQQLTKCVKKMRVFNIPLFLKHFSQHKIACESLSNENVVLFIGSTGAGKSTTIYFLKGVKMKRDENDYDHICPCETIARKELLNVKLKRSNRTSVTMNITPVPMMLKDVLLSNDNDDNEIKNQVIFCDTPGFGDSRGNEIDISNSFGLVNAMQSSYCVRIIFVISKEDMAHKMKQLKLLANSLYQYLANYKTNRNDNENKNDDSDNDTSSDESRSSSDDDDYYNNHNEKDDNDISLINENFLSKLKDINIIFTKFNNVESIKKLFNNSEMRLIESENKKCKSAFYYLCKHINKLVNSDNIILIDPINGDYKQVLKKMFVNNNGKWIKVTDDNFEPYISTENMLIIKEQVGKHCKYVERVINHHHNNNPFKTHNNNNNSNTHLNFDYFSLVQHKIDELSQLNDILGHQCGGITKHHLQGCIDCVTRLWNNICDTIIQNALVLTRNNTINSKTTKPNFCNYKSCINNVVQVLEQLVAKYRKFRDNHLPQAMSEDDVKNTVHKELKALLDDSRLDFTTTEEKHVHCVDDEKARDIGINESTAMNDPTNENSTDQTCDSIANTKAKTIDDHVNSLLRCLIILEHFGNDWNELLYDYLQEMHNKSSEYIKQNQFKHFVSVLQVLNGTIGKGSDLTTKTAENEARWSRLTSISKTMKQELNQHLESQVEITNVLLKQVNEMNTNMNKNINNSNVTSTNEISQVNNTSSSNNNMSINSTTYNGNELKEYQESDEMKLEAILGTLTQRYQIICKAKQELSKYFINDDAINPDTALQQVHQLFRQWCRLTETNIAQTLLTLTNKHHNEYNSRNSNNRKELASLVMIRNSIHAMNAVMEFSDNFISNSDKNKVIDSILDKIVDYLKIVSNINNLSVVVDEMKWIVNYYSNKHNLGRRFESTIVQAIINDLNGYINDDDNGLSLSHVKTSPETIETIVNQITNIGNCYYHSHKLFYGTCNINKVNQLIATTVNILQTKISMVFQDLFGIAVSDCDETKDDVNLDNNNDDMDYEQANDCLKLIEKCKKLNGHDIAASGGDQSEDSGIQVGITIRMKLINETLINTVKQRLKKHGNWLCDQIGTGLKNFAGIVEYLASNSNSFVNANHQKEADNVALFGHVMINLENRKPLSEHLFADKYDNMHNITDQWRKEMTTIYDKLNKVVTDYNSNDSIASMIISSTMIICTALIKVDNCGILDQGRTFYALTDKIESLIDNECKELTKCIQDRNFASVSQQLEKQQKQLLVTAKYDGVLEILSNTILTVIKQMIKLIEILPMTKMDKYLNIRTILQEYSEQTRQVLVLKMIKYINETNKNKFNEILKQLFAQARSSSGELLRLASLNVQESQYDELQCKMEILKDFEFKLMKLKPYQEVHNYETSENEMKQLINQVQQRLDQDRKNLEVLSVEDYHKQKQPSTILKTISDAASICNSFNNDGKGKKLKLTKCYKQSIDKIESKFCVVFERECKDIMKVGNNLYQHVIRVDRCRELTESLVAGNLKAKVEKILFKMETEFNRLRSEEDDKLVIKYKNEISSLMAAVWGAKRVILGDSIHKSTLIDFEMIFGEFLQRIKYQDEEMARILKTVMVDRIENECEEMERYMSENNLFDISSSSISKLHLRINEFKRIVTNVIQDDSCDLGLQCDISDVIAKVHEQNKQDIERCRNSIKQQFDKIEALQQRWFAVDQRLIIQKANVTQLATYIVRLVNGLMHYSMVLAGIIPDQIGNDSGVNYITKEICRLLNHYFEKWTEEVNEIIINNDFEASIPYLKTISIIEHNPAMKQIRSSIAGANLLRFSCNNISRIVKKHLQKTQNEILNSKTGLVIVNGGDVSRSMQMRIRQYEKLRDNLKVLYSSYKIDKYLDIYTNSELYQPCFTTLSDQIKAAIVAIRNEFIKSPNEESFRVINHLFSNLSGLASVEIFRELSSAEDKRLTKNVDDLKEKILSKLKEIGRKAYDKNASLNQVKESMIILQMAKHNLIDSGFQEIVSYAMEKAIVVQRNKHGIFALSQLFTKTKTKTSTAKTTTNDKSNEEKNDSKVDLNEVYWCQEIVNSFPIFSGAVIHSFNTKHGKNARDIEAAIDKMLVGKEGDTNANEKDKIKLKSLYYAFDTKYWQLVNKYIVHRSIKNTRDRNNIIRHLRVKMATIMSQKKINVENQIINLMAYIFCIWTLLDSQHFFEMKKQHDCHNRNRLRKKHSIRKTQSDKTPFDTFDVNSAAADFAQSTMSYNTVITGLEEQDKDIESESSAADKYTDRIFDLEVCKTYLRQPKATQVLAIMRLLGMNKVLLESNLIEIKTGEGKSLVLAVSACIIAFLGYHVICVCYGELLTQRDYNEFSDLFIQLKVANKIEYGVYDSVCSALVKTKTDIKRGILQLMSKTCKYNDKEGLKRSSKIHWNTSKTVMLIDEVDVLFDQRYFGSKYSPIMDLKHDCISGIMDLVWNLHSNGDLYIRDDLVAAMGDSDDVDNNGINLYNINGNDSDSDTYVDPIDDDPYVDHDDLHHRDSVFYQSQYNYKQQNINKREKLKKIQNKLSISERVQLMNMDVIKNTKEYRDCQDIFGFWMPLIDNAIKLMLRDVQTFEQHNYIVRDDRIGYYHEDRVTYNTRYGYHTTFAYYKEHSRKKISKKALEKEKVINLTYASVSYAELACQFKCVAGVTGTLSELEMSRKQFLQDKYKINKYTYIPTMFKENEFKFHKYNDVQAAEQLSWWRLIHNEIRSKIKCTNINGDHRPILVFFETNDELQAFYESFYNSNSISNSNTKCLILNQELTVNEKIKVIKDACRLNTVTLCTRIFGRGTDFIVIDDRVNEMGGAHVIQTFFSCDISEEIQIKGRTARNGGNGSFSMVLSKQRLKKMMDLYSYEYRDYALYDTLDEKRKRLQERLNERIMAKVKDQKEHHDKTETLIEFLKQQDKEQVLKVLLTLHN